MRVVHRKEAMADAISEAKSEAGAAFDSDEASPNMKSLANDARIDTLADRTTLSSEFSAMDRAIMSICMSVIAVFNANIRKIIEIAPAIGISEAVRQGVTDAAIRLAQVLNYGVSCANFHHFILKIC